MTLEISDTMFLLIVDLCLLLAALGFAALAARWLEAHPDAAITKWLDRQFRRVGL